MAQIVQSFAGDNALRLQNEEYVRTMNWGSNWRKLRIAIHISAPQATGTVYGPGMVFGVCAGTTNTYKSSNTTEWLGVGPKNNGINSTNYTAGPPAGITLQYGPYYMHRIGNTTTTDFSLSASPTIGKTNRNMWVADFIKTSTGYSISFFWTTSIPAVDLTQSNFRMYAARENLTSVFSYRENDPVNYTSSYALDSISVYWEFAPLPVEISEILAIRLA